MFLDEHEVIRFEKHANDFGPGVGVSGVQNYLELRVAGLVEGGREGVEDGAEGGVAQGDA